MGKRILPNHELGYRLGHCYDLEAREIPNMTKQIQNRIIKRIEDRNMQYVSVAVNGVQGSGKTEYVMFWAWMIQRTYPDQVWTIYADDINVVLEEAKKIPSWVRVVVVILEDMMSYQDSYSTQKDKQKAADWYLVRHKIKERIGNTGIIYGFLIWQRYTSVNANFRNTDMYALFSPMLNQNDADVIRRMIGDEGYQAVRQEYADRQIADVRRSRVVVHLSALDDPLAGFHDYQYVAASDPYWNYPKLLKSAEYFAPPPKKTKEDILSMIAEDRRYDGYTALYMSYLKGMNQRELSEMHGISQATVSRWIARVEEFIANGGEGLRPAETE